jgi:hypothetical protein
MMAFQNSQLAWVVGIGNPLETTANVPNKLFIFNPYGNPPVVVDSAGHVDIGYEYWVNPVQSNRLGVSGSVEIGQGYAGIVSAPSAGLGVEGQTAIGTSAPYAGAMLTVAGTGPEPVIVLDAYPYVYTDTNGNSITAETPNAINFWTTYSYDTNNWAYDTVWSQDTATGGELDIGLTYARHASLDSNSHMSFCLYPPAGQNSLDECGNMSVGFGNNPPSIPLLDVFIAGPVGIGTSSLNGYTLYVKGSAFSTGGFAPASDIRLKKDMEPFRDSALDMIDKLRPVTYQWKVPEDDGMKGRQIGFIAQDVRPVIPEAITVADDPQRTLGLKYDSLIPVLTKAIQELQSTNEALRSQIEALEAEQTELEHELRPVGPQLLEPNETDSEARSLPHNRLH